jgi:hypothetical protein
LNECDSFFSTLNPPRKKDLIPITSVHPEIPEMFQKLLSKILSALRNAVK